MPGSDSGKAGPSSDPGDGPFICPFIKKWQELPYFYGIFVKFMDKNETCIQEFFVL